MRADYVLVKSHHINRIERLPGSTVTLPVKLGEWLTEQGIARPATTGRVLVPGAKLKTESRQQLLVPPVRPGCCGWSGKR